MFSKRTSPEATGFPLSFCESLREASVLGKNISLGPFPYSSYNLRQNR